MKWKTEQRKLKDLIPYEHNPRNLTDKQREDLTASFKKFDLVELPAINTDNQLLAGHQRLKIMLELYGADHEIDVRVPGEKLTEAECQEYNIRSNKNTGEWNFDVLEDAFDFDDLVEWGFSEDELDFEITSDCEVTEDEAPGIPETPKTELGRIYQLGNHRLMCGDSTDSDQVAKLMNGEKADMVFTDPPYNIDYKTVSDKRDKIANDKMSDIDFSDFLTRSLMPCDTMYVCCSWQYSHLFKASMEAIGCKPKAMIIWDKVNPAQYLDKYYKQHELIFYYGLFGGQKTLRGDVWELKRQRNTVHPTMKPIELIAMALQDQSDKKIIYDGFGGSGSTLIACEQTNRQCRMMELDPKYCDVIVQRYCNLKNIDSAEVFETGIAE